ncbi:hypothetical protein BD414DRAFT_180238 [Trametes punicea]|nr:hypothetical protein BD414DRAFT_180238 [Trametes punicea]
MLTPTFSASDHLIDPTCQSLPPPPPPLALPIPLRPIVARTRTLVYADGYNPGVLLPHSLQHIGPISACCLPWVPMSSLSLPRDCRPFSPRPLPCHPCICL